MLVCVPEQDRRGGGDDGFRGRPRGVVPFLFACLIKVHHYAKQIFPSLYVLSASKSLTAFANLFELARLAAVLICVVCGFSLSL